MTQEAELAGCTLARRIGLIALRHHLYCIGWTTGKLEKIPARKHYENRGARRISRNVDTGHVDYDNTIKHAAYRRKRLEKQGITMGKQGRTEAQWTG